MMGLLSAPESMRLLARESTPVRLAVAIGHRLERTSRVTCSDARAASRATEISGLFFNARSSACFKDRDICVPALVGALDNCPFGVAFGAGGLEPGCGCGADGILCTVCGIPD